MRSVICTSGAARPGDRDRTVLTQDREQADRTKADTEYLARELAALRIAVGQEITRDYLRGELDTLAARLPQSRHPPEQRRRYPQNRPGTPNPLTSTCDRSR
jgi:uncharacterized membrane protein